MSCCATFPAQRRRFNTFRPEYNTERPHAALEQRPPATAYAPSPRAYPAHVPGFEYPAHVPGFEYPAHVPGFGYPAHFERRRVSRNGRIPWRKQWVNVSHVLAEDDVGLGEVGDAVWAVYIGPLLLHRFEARRAGSMERTTGIDCKLLPMSPV